jgi:hypothetical protein
MAAQKNHTRDLHEDRPVTSTRPVNSQQRISLRKPHSWSSREVRIRHLLEGESTKKAISAKTTLSSDTLSLSLSTIRAEE